MSPNNYLMLAKNIRDYLTEYLESKTIIDYVNEQYDILAENLSLKDADLRAIGKEADTKGTNTLVVSDNAFRFLENYGFEIISLDEETLTEGSLNSIRDAFDDDIYDTIFVLDNKYTDNINSIIEDFEVNTIDVDSMITYEESNTDCFQNMQTFIDNIRNLTLAD